MVHVAQQQVKIAVAFPELQKEFYDLLNDSLKRNGFTDKRLTDAVNFVIDNFKYPKPRIADFISYDQRIAVLTYHELINKVTSNDASFETWKAIRKDSFGNLIFAHVNDVEKYNIELYKKPE